MALVNPTETFYQCLEPPSLFTLTAISVDKTSRPVVRDEIQTSCNFEANISHYICCLDCVCCRYGYALLEKPYHHMVWHDRCVTVPSHLIFVVCENFPNPPSTTVSSASPFPQKEIQPKFRSYVASESKSTAGPKTTKTANAVNEYRTIQKDSDQRFVGSIDTTGLFFTVRHNPGFGR